MNGYFTETMTANAPFKFPAVCFIFFCCLANRLYAFPKPSKRVVVPTKDLVIITDMEPDDRIALAMVASQLANRVLAIGATVLHAERKAELARHALVGTELEGVQVYVGSGGTAQDYPKMHSTEAGRTYGDKEGKDILDDELLDKFIKNRPCAKTEGTEFQNYLQNLLERNDGRIIHFLVLAPPTDLTAVLCRKRELAKAIGQIHLMGGWNKPKSAANETDTDADTKNENTDPTNAGTKTDPNSDPSTDTKTDSSTDPKTDSTTAEKVVPVSAVLRSSYNVNMDGEASAQLLRMASDGEVHVMLYSAHVLAEQFDGGSVNRKRFPKLIDMIIHSEAPCMKAFRTAGKNWDTNLVDRYEKLRPFVEPYIGEQFTPADPITVLGFLKPELIKKTEKVKVNVVIPDKGETPSEDGYEVQVEKDDRSEITLITEFDVDMFGTEMERIVGEIEKNEAKRHKKATGETKREEEEDKE